MTIRPALPADADRICAVVRASIVELCHADHHGDPEILRLWLANKTPENVLRWLASPDNTNLVAVEGDTMLAAGCVTRAGEVVLNYVSPQARFRGVSSELLGALEEQARTAGNDRCRLDSTVTARRFYLARGYHGVGAPGEIFGLVSYPMAKALPERPGTPG